MNLQPGTNVRVDGKVKINKGYIEFIHPEIETFVDSNPLQVYHSNILSEGSNLSKK